MYSGIFFTALTAVRPPPSPSRSSHLHNARSHNLADVGNVVAGGHEVGEVVELQLTSITTRDDGFAASLDGEQAFCQCDDREDCG